MPSKKQIDANRLNAQKSTGPRSPEGKARSSMNALKSGIDAKSQVIRGEFEADLEALTSQYHDRFLPTTPEQRMLVDALIDSEWLLRRFRICEAHLWDEGSQQVHNLSLAPAFRLNADCFSRLQRRIDATHRNYRNALQELQLLQAEEDRTPVQKIIQEAVQETDPAPATHATQRNQTAKPANGFVPHGNTEDPPEPPPQPFASVPEPPLPPGGGQVGV
jgi:hypothetical protein